MSEGRIGRSLRTRRKELGYTLSEVGRRSGLSTAFLSQLENDRARPSLSSLQRVADALGTTAVALMAAAEEASEVDVVRAGEAEQLSPEVDDDAAAVRPLVRGQRQLHALEFSGGLHHEEREFVHRNDEIMYVVRDAVVVSAAGKEHHLEAGDALYCPGGVPHRWRALSPDTKLLVVAVSDSVRATTTDA